MRGAVPVLAVLLLLLLAPSAVGRVTLVDDPGAHEVAVLGRSIVWVSDAPNGRQVLMRRTGRVIGRVPGAPPARFYRSIDLGRGFDGRLVLTYQRCASGARCVVRVDDLHGRRARLRGLRLPGCELTGTPALWNRRVAYGLVCERDGELDERRSGVYVRTAGGAPRLLPRPRDAVRFGVVRTTRVDLRGRRVGYVLSDVFSYAVLQDVTGGRRSAFLAGASEGESDEQVAGLALATTSDLFTLTLAQHSDDPLQARIGRFTAGCLQQEVLGSPPGAARYRAIGLGAHLRRLLLAVPGIGIVAHPFAPRVAACPQAAATRDSRPASRR